MSNKLPIQIARNGILCVIKWTGDISGFVAKLTNRKKCLTAYLGEDKYLVVVSSRDADTISSHFVGEYQFSSEATSFHINRQLNEQEKEGLMRIVDILSNNGIISDAGMNFRTNKTGTYVNFSHGRNKECELVKLFMECK